jgi:predicted nucleic acid-binding protein
VKTLPRLRGQIEGGERQAIALATKVTADALLIDDRDGRRHAEALKCPVLCWGRSAFSRNAAERAFVELPVVLNRLRATNFCADRGLFEQILNKGR